MRVPKEGSGLTVAPTSNLRQFLVRKPCHPAGGEKEGMGKLSQLGETSKGYFVGFFLLCSVSNRIRSGESYGRGQAEPAAVLHGCRGPKSSSS